MDPLRPVDRVDWRQVAATVADSWGWGSAAEDRVLEIADHAGIEVDSADLVVEHVEMLAVRLV